MNIGVVGTGAMGSMLISSYFKFSTAKDASIFASNRSKAALDALKQRCPNVNVRTNTQVADEADCVFICTKPDVLLKTAAEMAPALGERKLLVSISNGVSLESLGAVVRCRVIKMIPSIVHSVGRGACLIMDGPRSNSTDRELVASFMRCMSRPVCIDAVDSRVATNITGCGPAIVAAFCETLVRQSAEFASALSIETLNTLAVETLIATASMLESGTPFSRIVSGTSTGGGMTAAAIAALQSELPGALRSMILATIARESVVRSSVVS